MKRHRRRCTPTGKKHPAARVLEDPKLRARLLHYAASMCGSKEDAEDVVQETLLCAFSKLDQLKDRSKVSAWTCRIARNVFLQQKRISRFAPRAFLPLDDMEPGDHQRLAETWSPESDILRTHRWRLTLNAVSELPEKYRVIVEMRDFGEQSNLEVASLLGVTSEVTRTRLKRAHAKLREMCSALF